MKTRNFIPKFSWASMALTWTVWRDNLSGMVSTNQFCLPQVEFLRIWMSLLVRSCCIGWGWQLRIYGNFVIFVVLSFLCYAIFDCSKVLGNWQYWCEYWAFCIINLCYYASLWKKIYCKIVGSVVTVINRIEIIFPFSKALISETQGIGMISQESSRVKSNWYVIFLYLVC